MIQIGKINCIDFKIENINDKNERKYEKADKSACFFFYFMI